jgi:ferric-dicitrate binding protein FerR (iron transport regulator)
MDHDPLAEFRALAPHRPPIRIQRWTRRRVLGLLLLVATVGLAFWLLLLNQSVVRGLL